MNSMIFFTAVFISRCLLDAWVTHERNKDFPFCATERYLGQFESSELVKKIPAPAK